MTLALPLRLLTAMVVALGTPGCAALFAGKAEAPEVLAERVRQTPVALDALGLAPAPTGPSLRIREVGLAEVTLGAPSDRVRARFGPPVRTAEGPEGLWWDFEELSPVPIEKRLGAAEAPPDAQLEPDAWKQLAHVRVLMARQAGQDGPAQVVHVQAWAPARFQTRSLVRPLDPATRVLRKYGEPPRTVRWGGSGGEAWIYPDANVAFVVTPDHPEQPRVVAGILVGVTR